jgi:hypothetical protein
MRYFKITNNSPTEGSLSRWLPNTSNPTLLTPAELLAAGIHTLTEPEPIEGSRWVAVAPTVVEGSLVGGWVSEVVPEPDPVPDWQSFMDDLDRDPSAPETPGIFDALISANDALALTSYQLCLRGVDGTIGSREIRTLNFIYSQLSAGFRTELSAALSTAVTNNRIPIEL